MPYVIIVPYVSLYMYVYDIFLPYLYPFIAVQNCFQIGTSGYNYQISLLLASTRPFYR